ncbi:MAG TPA: 6-phosphogluconolactonase [Pyrinomonadaceae bacterium]|jgi:6-phosphogluconolactonase
MELKVFRNPTEVARAAGQHFVEQCRKAVGRSNGFGVALSGGSTPKLFYELLANAEEPFREQIAWDKTRFFFTDERNVPPDHPESNYRMVREAMLAHVPRPTQVYRIPGEKRAAEAAEEYEDTLTEVFEEDVPDLDLVLLGLGEEGHTASLFPHSPALKETKRLVVAPWVEKLNAYRISLTLPVLNNGQSVVFLVTGESKAEILREVIKTNPNPDLYPAQAIQPVHGELTWLVDEAAARLIK